MIMTNKIILKSKIWYINFVFKNLYVENYILKIVFYD